MTAAVIAAAAGTLALGGVLYEVGVRPAWLERWHQRWMVSSDSMADRAYQVFLTGQREEGLALFRLALERDPASPYRWCDYGEALLANGETEQSRHAVQRGVELGPWEGAIRMRAVNFAYRTGNTAEALEQGKQLLKMTSVYDDAVFEVWRHMEVAPDEAMDRGIPDARSAQGYLRHAIGYDAGAAAAKAWAWLLAKNAIDDKLADDYAGFLVRRRAYDEASAAWRDSTGAKERGYPEGNAVFNGGFEREPAGTIFDWRMEPVEGARIERDGQVAAEGRYSLRVEFVGTENLAFGGVSQRIVVSEGTWHFEARMRTDGVTTAEGARIRIRDAEAAERLEVATQNLTGTHEWTKVAADFRVSKGTHIVELRVVRDRTWKFDSKVRGSVWVDGVVLQRTK
jgi:hypothetical protein